MAGRRSRRGAVTGLIPFVLMLGFLANPAGVRDETLGAVVQWYVARLVQTQEPTP